MTTTPDQQNDSIAILLPSGEPSIFVRGRAGAYWSAGDHMVGIFLLAITPGTEFWDGSPAQSYEGWSREFADILYDDLDPDSVKLFGGAAKFLDAKHQTALNYFPLSKLSDEKEYQTEYSPAVEVGRRLLGELAAAEEEPLSDEPEADHAAPVVIEAPPEPAPVVVYDDAMEIDPLTRKLLEQGGELADEIREEMALERAAREHITGRELARPIEEARTWLLQLLARRAQDLGDSELRPSRRVLLLGYKDLPSEVAVATKEQGEEARRSLDEQEPSTLGFTPWPCEMLSEREIATLQGFSLDGQSAKIPGESPRAPQQFISLNSKGIQPSRIEVEQDHPLQAESASVQILMRVTDAELAQILRDRGVHKLSDLKALGIKLGFGFTAPKAPKEAKRHGVAQE